MVYQVVLSGSNVYGRMCPGMNVDILLAAGLDCAPVPSSRNAEISGTGAKHAVHALGMMI